MLAPVNETKPGISTLSRWLPALQRLRSYDRAWFKFNAIAGLTAASVVVPQAYGSIAGFDECASVHIE
jgi:MFS superfamily sulfate permease-like transporter